MITEDDAERHLCYHLFYGIVKGLMKSIRYLYDDQKVSYIQLLVAARKAEIEASDTKNITAKAGVLGGNHSAEIGTLMKLISTLMSMMQGKNGKG